MAQNSRIFNILSTNFDRFDSTITNYLAKSFEGIGMSMNNSQVYNVIFKGIKGVMQNIMVYLEDVITEQNILTASRRKSVYALAKLSGYEPYFGSAASGTLVCSIKPTNSLKSIATHIYFNNYQEVVNKTTGVIYSIVLNSNKYMFDITSSITKHEIKIVQGRFKYSQTTSKGESLERVSINVSGLFDREYITVYVNGKKWSMVSSLYDMGKDTENYVLEVGYDNTFDVIFGNGIYGKIPPAGQTITVYYLAHSGTIGNIDVNSISAFQFDGLGYDGYGNTVNLNNYINLTIDNVISGGTNADDIDFVRDMVGKNSRCNVLASEDNFQLFFKRFSFVGNAECWSDSNSMLISAVCTSNVINNLAEYSDYLNINPDDICLTQNHKLMILNALNNSGKTFAGLSVSLIDPVVRQFSINCYLKSKNVYTRNIVKQDVTNAFAKYFCELNDDVHFIPKSDLITVALEANDEIESFDIDIISKTAEDTYKIGYYYTYELKLINDAYQYVPVQVFYEKNTTPCIDNYGNIKLDSNLEIPMLHGGFKYYPNKEENDKKTEIMLDAIQFFFI